MGWAKLPRTPVPISEPQFPRLLKMRALLPLSADQVAQGMAMRLQGYTRQGVMARKGSMQTAKWEVTSKPHFIPSLLKLSLH